MRPAQSWSSTAAPPHDPGTPTTAWRSAHEPRRNHQVRLAARPSGLPRRSDWSFTEEPVPAPGAGEFVVAISHISLDPAMRGWMNAGASYIDPVEIGDVMRAGAVGRGDRLRAPRVRRRRARLRRVRRPGVRRSPTARGAFKVDPSLAPLPTYLGTLGLPGMTAYFGLLDVGKLKEGDTVVVSGAAGAVGSVAGQIAKIKGCRVIGIAGGEEKCRWLTEELGFDAAIDYKAEDVRRALRESAPDRVDVYFDNVGGEILDAVLTRLARGARIVICGAVSQYNATDGCARPVELPVPARGPRLDDRHGRLRLRRHASARRWARSPAGCTRAG